LNRRLKVCFKPIYFGQKSLYHFAKSPDLFFGETFNIAAFPILMSSLYFLENHHYTKISHLFVLGLKISKDFAKYFALNMLKNLVLEIEVMERIVVSFAIDYAYNWGCRRFMLRYFIYQPPNSKAQK
jgi:hypothetical protein